MSLDWDIQKLNSMIMKLSADIRALEVEKDLLERTLRDKLDQRDGKGKYKNV